MNTYQSRITNLTYSFFQNILFWLTNLIIAIYCGIYFDGSNYSIFVRIILSFLSGFFAMMFGYWVHVYSHYVDHEKVFQRLLPKYVLETKIVKYILYYLDFHVKIHHSKEGNTSYNMVFEGFQNLLSQSVLLIVIILSLNYLLNITIPANFLMILLWGIFYVSIHFINYNFFESNAHKQHHINPKTNYGIDTFDIMFGSQSHPNDNEKFNNFSINNIIILICIKFIYINNIINEFVCGNFI